MYLGMALDAELRRRSIVMYLGLAFDADLASAEHPYSQSTGAYLGWAFDDRTCDGGAFRLLI